MMGTKTEKLNDFVVRKRSQGFNVSIERIGSSAFVCWNNGLVGGGRSLQSLDSGEVKK